jgi:hypothetical protein
LAGRIRERVEPPLRSKSGERCSARRRFVATLGDTDTYVPVREAGHYSGSSEAGLPVEFDLGYDKARNATVISNLSIAVEVECWEDLDDDGSDDVIVAKLGGFGGPVDANGEFFIEYVAGEDVEYQFEGRIADGSARIEALIGGLFDPDGLPNPAGPLSCDNFGAVYHAQRVP